jgi:hypothetical protein
MARLALAGVVGVAAACPSCGAKRDEHPPPLPRVSHHDDRSRLRGRSTRIIDHDR